MVLDKVSEIVNFIRQLHCFVTKWVAVTKYYCCTWSFDGYHEAEFGFMYSHCAQTFCFSVLTIPSRFHHICVAPEVSIFAKKLTKFIIPRCGYYILSACGKIESPLCKIEIWRMCIEINVTDYFQTLNDFFN
jgi:hypothetical protein